MKEHPSEQQWMEYLYEEATPAEKATLDSHLGECLVCQQQTAAWRGAMEKLDDWQIAPTARQAPIFSGWTGAWKWAAAACLIFTTAFAAGRLSNPGWDAEAIQAQISEPLRKSIAQELERKMAAQTTAAADRMLAGLRADLQQELNQVAARASAEAVAASEKQFEQLALTMASLRQEDKQAVLTALQELESRRLADLRALRQELETVAVNTDNSFRVAQRQLVQLAAYSQPSSGGRNE